MPNFKIGDVVQWESQAHGITKAKAGEVVGIVPAGGRPDRNLFPGLYKGAGPGLGRDHESYIVKVKSKIYWPLVSKLSSSKQARIIILLQRGLVQDVYIEGAGVPNHAVVVDQDVEGVDVDEVTQILIGGYVSRASIRAVGIHELNSDLTCDSLIKALVKKWDEEGPGPCK